MERERSSSISADSRRLLLLLVLPAVLWCIPLRWILHGESICLIKKLFGVECYGCGTVRALFSLLHFDFAAAWHYNPLSYPVALLLGYLYLKELSKAIGRPQ